MARRSVIEVSSPPKLVIPREKVREILNTQLEKGKEIQATNFNSVDDLENAIGNKQKWRNYIAEVLLRSFDNDSVQKEFTSSYGAMRMAMDIQDRIDNFQNDINAKITALESIIERLDLIPENIELEQPEPAEVVNEAKKPPLKEVFIVHGHDHKIKTEVARFVESGGLTPIILHEQANEGMTLIEKLERYSSVGFAIVLLTADDMGYPKEGKSEDAKPRARQNVIAELGYFVGKLGRNRVAVLLTPEVEIPTDFLGLVYTEIGTDEGWKIKLAKELKNANMEFDLNLAL